MLRTPLGKPSVKLNEPTALIGAIFNADLQVGSTIGLSITNAITTRINGPGGDSNFAGYRASFWFTVGVCGVEAILAAAFLGRNKIPESSSVEATIVEEEKKESKDLTRTSTRSQNPAQATSVVIE